MSDMQCESAEYGSNKDAKQSAEGSGDGHPIESTLQEPRLSLTPTTEPSHPGIAVEASEPPSLRPLEITVETLSRPLPLVLSEHQQRQWLWERVGGERTFRAPIIGPFQMKLPPFAPFNSFVTGPDFDDLKEITNELLPRGLALTLEITKTNSRHEDFDEVLTLWFAKDCGDKIYDQVELVRFWGYMTEWLSTVYHGEPATLCDHLGEAVVSANRNLEPVSANLDDLYSSHRRLSGSED
ncbi:hypothetical protein FPCIR_11560 [Fusarium pseudocircinatum]|uniref:Uncharacterized protein n=1 Tax=Fusarium pseudocircinatum TaxID=56676 RepID=A0A8H5KQA0_9HYPO|nr:hypothetical protein FPCIR_11560 [Fusarium pseudocircinatum]